MIKKIRIRGEETLFSADSGIIVFKGHSWVFVFFWAFVPIIGFAYFSHYFMVYYSSFLKYLVLQRNHYRQKHCSPF